jgi:gamma-glutamylcyclotransferase (GGCT)/AIG2-like uncharacterized protein YtfP
MPETPGSSSIPARYAFVYGTLRRGDDNDITRLTPAPQFVGNASVEGVMHHLGAYPGLVLTPGRAVVGEVYAITPELELKLDEIEMIYPEQKDEYFKREISVLVDGHALTCVVYEINPSYIVGRPVIESGDWVLGRYL